MKRTCLKDGFFAKVAIFLLLLLPFVAQSQPMSATPEEPCIGLHNPLSLMGWYGKNGARGGSNSCPSVIDHTSSAAQNLATSATSQAVWNTTNYLGLIGMDTLTSRPRSIDNSYAPCYNYGSALDKNMMEFQVITDAGFDSYTNNHINRIPDGSVSCIRLGDIWSGQGKSAQALYYELDVRPYNSLLFIDYAIVMISPHQSLNIDPEFIVRVTEPVYGSDGVTITGWQNVPMAYPYSYVIASPSDMNNLPTGWDKFQPSGVGCNHYFVFKDWAHAAISFGEDMWYKKVRLEFYISDCKWEYDGAYCYISGSCQPMQLHANGCAAGAGDTVATITAPAGLNNYRWYRNVSVNGGQPTSSDTLYVEVLGQNGQPIDGPSDSVLAVKQEHFIANNGDTLTTNMFKCVMTSYLDPAKPIVSEVFTELKNLKPKTSFDSIYYCDGTVTLIDYSDAPYIDNPSDHVDTSLSIWNFHDGVFPLGEVVHTDTAGSTSYQFSTPGPKWATLRSVAANGECWNEKVINFRALSTPQPVIELSDNDICFGDSILITDATQPQVENRLWVIHHNDGTSDTLASTAQVIRLGFEHTEDVELVVRNGSQSVNASEPEVCENTTRVTVRVGEFPILKVSGDTIVCTGSQAHVHVEALNVEVSSYKWYRSRGVEGSLIQTGQDLSEIPTSDTRYYVKVTSLNGCESWDSLDIKIVKPKLTAPITQMCEGETVSLIGSDAFAYTWTSVPFDATLVGQESNSEIHVSPSVTTTYTLVGHGQQEGGLCDATPLSKQITVFPYPRIAVEFSPSFVDSEEPQVTFRDVSQGRSSTAWLFEQNFDTIKGETVLYTFNDITSDSVQVVMISSNQLGCSSDTMFNLPVSLFSVWIPNAFTPDNSTNEVFKVFTHNELEYYSMRVYSRSGLLVFSSHNQEESWDGTFKGEKLPQGGYVYQCTYRRPGTSDIVNRSGTVLLIR